MARNVGGRGGCHCLIWSGNKDRNEGKQLRQYFQLMSEAVRGSFDSGLDTNTLVFRFNNKLVCSSQVDTLKMEKTRRLGNEALRKSF